VQVKNTKFNTIREVIRDVDRLITKNTHAPIDILHPSRIKMKVDLTLLDIFQQDRKRVDRETTISMVIYSQLHKVAQDLTRKCHIPPLQELGKTLVMEQLIEKV